MCELLSEEERKSWPEGANHDRDQENVVPIPVPPPVIWVDTPHLVVLRELIPIKDPAPVVPSIEVDAKGEDNTWYNPQCSIIESILWMSTQLLMWIQYQTMWSQLGRIPWQVLSETIFPWMGLMMRCGWSSGSWHVSK